MIRSARLSSGVPVPGCGTTEPKPATALYDVCGTLVSALSTPPPPQFGSGVHFVPSNAKTGNDFRTKHSGVPGWAALGPRSTMLAGIIVNALLLASRYPSDQ